MEYANAPTSVPTPSPIKSHPQSNIAGYSTAMETPKSKLHTRAYKHDENDLKSSVPFSPTNQPVANFIQVR
jgi:hypothetical protein